MKETTASCSSSVSQEPRITSSSASAIARRLSQSLFFNNSVLLPSHSVQLESITEVVSSAIPIPSTHTGLSTSPSFQATSAIDIARRLRHSLRTQAISTVAHNERPLPIVDALEQTAATQISQDVSPSFFTPLQHSSTGDFLEGDSGDSQSSTPEKRKPMTTHSGNGDTPTCSVQENSKNGSDISHPSSEKSSSASTLSEHFHEPGIELTEVIVNEQGSSIAPRPQAQSDKVSEPLALFLKHMAIPLHVFDPSELDMLEVILAPKTWKQKLPSYLRLPVASELITKVLFYMAIHKKDLASAHALSGLNENELSKALRIEGNAIPLFNEQAITRAYRIAGFSNTISWVGGVWLLLYLSLQVNAFILEVQNGQTDYKFSDIFFEPYNLYQIFTDTGQSTKASLVNSLSSYAVWPFLMGIPLLAGAFSSWRYGLMAQTKTESTAQADLTLLKNYVPNVWLDYIRWYLPNHPLSGPLNRLRMNMLFNANESISHRKQSFEVLGQFLAKAKGHTQISARVVMAALAFSISPRDLIQAKQIFPEADYTDVIKTIANAYSNLMGTAFSLQPQENENRLDALLRGSKTRYLSHHQQLGHAGNLLLLFILYDFYISYGDSSLFLIVLKGIIKAFKNVDEMVKCKQDNKIWEWRKESKNYECSVCGDEDQIAYRDIWTQESCVTAFLARPQSAQKIVHFFSAHHLQDITAIDFSAQLNAGWTVYHTAEELDMIFMALNEHVPNIYNFTFRGSDSGSALDAYPDSSYAGAALGRFLANAKNLKIADFSNLFLQANGTVDLAFHLPATRLTSLNLNYNIASDDGVLAIANVLPQTQLVSLNLNNCESSDSAIPPFVAACLATPKLLDIAFGASYTSDASAEELSKLLLQPNLRRLAVYSFFYTDVALMFYAARLAQAKNLTKLSIEYCSMTNAETIRALSDGLAQTPNQELILQGYSNEPTVPDLAYFFYKLKDMPTTVLQIGGSACVDEASAEAFSLYMPQSQVQRFHILLCFNPPLSANATAYFASGLFLSNISSLTLNIMNLNNSFAGNLQRIILKPHLDFLELFATNFDEPFNLAMMALLPDSHLATLRIAMNGITDSVVNQMAEVLNQTRLKVICFGGKKINSSSIEHLFDKATLPGSSIESFEIYGSNLGDDGASYIASRLADTSLQHLMLQTSSIGDIGASNIAQALVHSVRYNLLWLDLLLQADPIRREPATQLKSLLLRENNITPVGARAIIEQLPYTDLPFSNTDFSLNVNLTNIELAAISMTSSASRQATIPWPIQVTFALLFTLPKQLLTSVSQHMLTCVSPLTDVKDNNNESRNSSIDLVTSLLIMFVVYRFILFSMKEKPTQRSQFRFFDTANTLNPANEERSAAQEEIRYP